MSATFNLLESLIHAMSEEEVARIVDSDPLLRNPAAWRPYVSPERFGLVLAQQPDPVSALTERLVNSIDAVLTKECLLKGIDPKGANAPGSMPSAVEMFFGIRDGDFAEVSNQRRRELAQQIMLLADGSKQAPNLLLVDRGEGQHPSDFSATFLSLLTGNKLQIPFVQGQFNMGGTGVARYCQYQLIASRRHPSLLDGKSDAWGFTLIRRHFPGPNEPSSHLEYFASNDGSILTTEAIPLTLPGGATLDQGTIIKLYKYRLPTTTVVTLDLWRDLNRRLYAPALPILIWETRSYAGHSASKILLGNKVRVEVDDRNSVETSLETHAELGSLGMRTVDITVFRQDYRKNDFSSPTDAILFTINGQTHATLSRSFIRTKAKLGYLADYMLVHVDCTEIPASAREQVFMSSRDRMEAGEYKAAIESALADALGNHEALRELNEARRQAQISSHPQDTRFLETIVAKLAKKNRNIIEYLKKGGLIRGGIGPGTRRAPKYEGKYIPTFLTADGRNGSGPVLKQIPINSYAVVHLETDARNDYLSRSRERGTLTVNPEIAKSWHLWNGTISLKIIPAEGRPGDQVPITVTLTRPNLPPLIEEVRAVLAPPKEIKERPDRPDRPPPSPPPQPDYTLPPRTLVYKEKREGHRSWQEMVPEPWDAQVIAKVVPSSEGVDVFINMDSAALHGFLRTRRASQAEEEAILRSYEASIFLHSLVLHHDLAKFDNEEVFEAAIRGVAKITLDLIHNASFLEASDD
jgi:hypothetical protein